MAPALPPIVLFGYESSPFTQKVRLTLRLLQIPYTFVLVPSMMPRPILRDNFGLSYRKIPVCAIGREIHCDTSLIVEWLSEHPQLKAWRAMQNNRGQDIYASPRERSMCRILASFFTDRPLFRLTTGVIPSVVWRTKFGEDRAGLIGHKLDPDKLEAKVPRNLVALDTLLSVLEPMFTGGDGGWVLGGEKPSAADVSLFYQLEWGEKIARGEGIKDLTAQGTADGIGEGIAEVWNQARHPALLKWFERFKAHIDALPDCETRVEKVDLEGIESVMAKLKDFELSREIPLLPTTSASLQRLESRNGLEVGMRVSVAPDDTGRGNPTLGKLLALSPEEVVIQPEDEAGSRSRIGEVRLHFPRIGFIVVPVREAKL